MADKPRRLAPRNPVVRNATILRKGGAHGRSRKAERQDRKVQLRREIRQDRESPFCFPPMFPVIEIRYGISRRISNLLSFIDQHA